MQNRVSKELAACRLLDSQGVETAFSELWSDGPVLAVFIRHFACIACSENVEILLPRLGELHALGIRTALVGNGPSTSIEGFMEKRRLLHEHVEVFTDPTIEVHRQAGLKRSFLASWGPKAGLDALRALLAGHMQTSFDGDSLQQGGALLIGSDGEIVFRHRSRSLGDHAPANDLVAAAMAHFTRCNPGTG
jgi:hypothetical protein